MAQLTLSPGLAWQDLKLDLAEVVLLEGFLGAREALDLFETFHRETAWRQDRIRVMGKEHPLPRLQAWYGDPVEYVWSGVRLTPHPWTPALQALRARVEEATGASYSSVLLNLYRDGQDSVAWHADDEPGLAPGAPIASVSLGAARDFQLRRTWMGSAAGPIVTVPLRPGSLLVMGGETQRHWRHALPRRRRVAGARINLTFRRMR